MDEVFYKKATAYDIINIVAFEKDPKKRTIIRYWSVIILATNSVLKRFRRKSFQFNLFTKIQLARSYRKWFDMPASSVQVNYI